MKYFVLENFNMDEIKDLCSVLEECKEDDTLEITLSSWWWEVIALERIAQIINESKINIKIIVAEAQSSWFQLLLSVNCTIEILSSGFWMIHKWSWKVDIRDWWDTNNFWKFKIQYLKDNKFDTWYLTKSEKKKYNNNENIYFNAIRLRKIIKQKKTRK